MNANEIHEAILGKARLRGGIGLSVMQARVLSTLGNEYNGGLSGKVMVNRLKVYGREMDLAEAIAGLMEIGLVKAKKSKRKYLGEYPLLFYPVR